MKPVRNFPAYQANEEGVVFRGSRPLKASPNEKGYMRVFLRKNNQTHTRYVHRVICETFHGPAKDGYEVRHKNGVRSDNRAANLAWATHSENEADKQAHGTLIWGEKAAHSKLTNFVVSEMRNMVRNGASMQDAARHYEVNEKVAADAITGRRWARLPGAVEAFTTRRKLTAEQVRQVRQLSGKMRQSDIGAMFGIGRTAVQAIIHRRSYDWVE
jgi:hypothetical protein